MSTAEATAGVTRHRRARFHRLRVIGVESMTPDAIAVTFEVPAELTEQYRFRPGQHVAIRSDHGGAGVRRNYSIASPMGGALRVGIKRIPEGVFSGWALSELSEGMELEVMTPAGEFGVRPDPSRRRHVVAVAAGSGITPIISIVTSILGVEPNSRVSLLYGNRTYEDTMFADELADLKDRYPARLQLQYFFSRQPQVSPLRAGRLDADKLALVVDGLHLEAADGWYLCGPHPAITGWTEALARAGVPADRVHREIFHVDRGTGPGAPAAAAPEPGTGRALRFVLDGRGAEVALGPEETVLDGVLRARPDAPFACRGGVCGTCRAVVTAGSVQMDVNYALEPDEVSRGFVLTCQARPQTDDVEVDFDR